jgi:RecG-like helicase
MPEQRKRNIAYKLKVGDILRGKPILDESQNNRFNFLELGDKRIVRVNVIANVIDKFVASGQTKFANITLDDASGQITARVFGDDINLFENKSEGDTIRVIGVLRYYNEEVYILPEIIKKLDPRYLLVRKLELEKNQPKKEINKNEIRAVKDQILDMIKKAEQQENEGVDTEKLVMEIKAEPELINQEIKKLLEEGRIYEPKPGVVRFLG